MSSTQQFSCRIGFVIRDLRAATLHWLQSHGTGPWLFMKEVTETNYIAGQITYFVDNLDTAIEHFISRRGIGPWFRATDIKPTSSEYRGAPCSLSYSKAYANSGDSQEMVIELVEISASGPSIFAELFDSNTSAPPGSMHALPLGTKGVSALSCWYLQPTSTIRAKRYEFLKRGYEVVHQIAGDNPDETIIALENANAPGLLVEIAETDLNKLNLMKAVIEAGRNWNGENPVRSLPGLATIS